jgi:hypothetical protein
VPLGGPPLETVERGPRGRSSDALADNPTTHTACSRTDALVRCRRPVSVRRRHVPSENDPEGTNAELSRRPNAHSMRTHREHPTAGRG